MLSFSAPRSFAFVIRSGYLVLGLFLGSCRPQFLDTVDLELPSKLVVGCNLVLESDPIFQNDSLFLKLNQSAPLFGQPANSDSGLAGATLRLVRQRPGLVPGPDDTLSVFGFDELRSLYGAKVRRNDGSSFVQEGFTYHLSVRSADGRSVESSTTVPVWRFSDTTMQVLVQGSPSTWTRSVQIRVQWRDLTGANGSQDPGYYRVNYRITGNPWFDEDHWLNDHLGWYPNQLVNAGTAVNGLFTWQDRKDLSMMPGDTLQSIGRLEVAIQRISPELFRYLRAVGQQDAQDGNPFSEPAVIPSNISNGLGCFGSCVQIRLSKPLPW